MLFPILQETEQGFHDYIKVNSFFWTTLSIIVKSYVLKLNMFCYIMSKFSSSTLSNYSRQFILIS